MKKLLSAFLSILMILTCVAPCICVNATETENAYLNIHALYLTDTEGNAGEGDAVLLESNGHYLLMDCGMGNYPYAENPTTQKKKDVSAMIMKYLDKEGVDKTKTLDIYISHNHNDHYGGMYNIINSGKYNIGTIYVPARKIANAGQSDKTKTEFAYRNIYTNEKKTYTNKAIDKAKVVYLAPASINCGTENTVSTFSFGYCTVDVIGPVRLCTSSNLSGASITQIENNNSLCSVVTCGKYKYLTMGDALDFEEYDLVEKYKNTSVLDADVFKENHHGYMKSNPYLSNTEELYSAVTPKYAFCQNNAGQNVTVQRIVRKYGESLELFVEQKSMVYQLVNSSTGNDGVFRSFCSHSALNKVFTRVNNDDMEKHKYSITCADCGKTETRTEQHLWDADGNCTVCDYTCPHTHLVDGVVKNNYASADRRCYNCRMLCKHNSWWSSTGKCTTCYMLCEHDEWDADGGYCQRCYHSHSLNKVSEKAPTCTTDGNVEYWDCSYCLKQYADEDGNERIDPTVLATGHNYKSSTTPAKTSANGKIVKTCSCGDTKTEPIYKPTTYTISTSTYTYDGKVKSPSLTIKDSKGNTLKKDTDYTISTPSGRKNVGTYTYKITFKGKYSGTATKSFKINPVKTSISKLTATSKGFKATWSKKSTQVTGYQIQYSTSSKFSSTKTVTVSSYKTTSKTVSKLTGKKKYYVRIRTYKTVNGTKYYSAWSSAKSITTKK